MAKIQTPEPGVYDDVPAHEYHQWDAASNSRLKILRDKSPAHLRYELDNPSEQTPAMMLGEAIHMAVLETDLFTERYDTPSQCQATKKGDGERCRSTGSVRIEGRWYCGVRGHAPEGEAEEAARGIYRSVANHPAGGVLIGGPTERSIVWDDEGTGVRCKARIDVMPDGIATIGDLKTTRDASPERFTKAVYEYGYYMQAAMYLEGAKTLGLDAEWFTIIAAEKEPPYAVAVYRVRDDAIYAGSEEIRPLLETWAECEATGNWPGYPTEAVDISLPPWSWKKIDERTGVPA